jgi:hypothetical protein
LNECLLEDIIESSEKESFVSCPNIAINEEEVDKDETCNDSNCVPFAGQIFLSDEEAFAFYKIYAYQQGFAIKKKGRFVKKWELLAEVRFFLLS